MSARAVSEDGFAGENRAFAHSTRDDQRTAKWRRQRRDYVRRAHLVFFSIFLCLCLRIFLRRFLITEPICQGL